MKIKTKITLYFVVSTAILFILFSILIYYTSEKFRSEQFFSRLENKAITTARLLFEIEEVDLVLMEAIKNADNTILFREKVMIFDEKKNLIYKSRNIEDVIITNDFINSVIENNIAKKTIKGFEIVGVKYIEKGNVYVAVAYAYDKFGYNKQYNLLRMLLIGIIIAIILLFNIGIIFAKKSLEPISLVIDQVENITIKNLNVNVKYKNTKDEIAHLAQTFNRLLVRLDASFKSQKSFVSSASHELRNPFASIIGQIDVTLLKDRNSEEYKKVLASIRDDIKKLITLTNRLLLLAQTSENTTNVAFKECNIDEVLWKSREHLLKINPDFNINISFSKYPDSENLLKRNASEQLLEIAFSNLMENACKFSEDKKVEVIIEADSIFLEIKFIDFGTGIAENDLDLIFQPFYRVKSTSDIKGYGIGLPLVKNIMNIHNCSIEVNSKIGSGSTFTLTFPKA